MVPIVAITNITVSIPVINYFVVIPSSPSMLLSHTFTVYSGTFVEASIFASNEYGSGAVASAAIQLEGIYRRKKRERGEE